MSDVDQWARVGKYVQNRMDARGLTDEAVASAARVSRATVAEIRAGKPRRRPARTRAPVSTALGWTSDSIQRILDGGEPEDAPPIDPGASDISAHFAAIDARFDRLEQMMRQILERERVQ